MSPGVLLVTERADLAADLLVLRLRQLNIRFWRFNFDEFPSRLTIAWSPGGGFQVHRNSVPFFCSRDVSSAWYRYTPDPQLESFGFDSDTINSVTVESRAFLEGILEGADWYWMNRPSAVLRARNKLLQLQRAHDYGLAIPETVVTNDPSAARTTAGPWCNQSGLVAKAVVGGKILRGEQAYGLFTQPLSFDQLDDDTSIQAAPSIFQRRIPRACDIRVTVIDSTVSATEVRSRRPVAAPVDWRLADSSEITYHPHALPREVEVASCDLVRGFGLVFGALDFILTPDGTYVFLELNPSGQWGWLEAATNQDITGAIVHSLMAGGRIV